MVAEFAGKMRQQISDEVEGKMVYLEVDVASRHLRSFLGINVSYCLEFELKTRHLSCLELNERHSA